LSEDHRPDRQHVVVGVILGGDGEPICCELWPGNTTDVKTLIPIVNCLREEPDNERFCVLADCDVISKDTMTELRKSVRSASYVFGARGVRSRKRTRPCWRTQSVL
jgi:transposase